MTNEISFGKARIILLPILLGLVIIFFLKLFSIKIFSSFWILAILAVVTIITFFVVLSRKSETSALSSLTAKLPLLKKAVGWTVVAVALVVLVIVIAQSDFLRGVTVFQPNVFKGLDGWESSGGAFEGGGNVFVVLPSGASIKREFEADTIASVALYGPKPTNGKSSAQLEIFIKDQYNYNKDFECVFRRDAKAKVTVTGNGVSFPEEVKFGNELETIKLSPDGNWLDEDHQKNYFALVVNLNHITSTCGSGGNFSLLNWEIFPEGYRSRKTKRPFSETISNTGDAELEIGSIVIPEVK